MGNAPPSRGAAASLSRGELGAVVAIVLMLRRWARSSWRGVFAYARSWRSSCLRTCCHYDGGTGSRHEGASSLWRGWPIRRADLPLPRAGSSIRRAGSPLRKSNLSLRRAGSPLRRGDLPLRRGDLRQECHKSGDNVMKNETGRVYGNFAPCFLQVFQELRASIRGVSKFVTLSPDLRHPVTGFAAADVRASVFGVDSPISFWDRWPLDRFAHLFWGHRPLEWVRPSALGSLGQSAFGSFGLSVRPSSLGTDRPVNRWIDLPAGPSIGR